MEKMGKEESKKQDVQIDSKNVKPINSKLGQNMDKWTIDQVSHFCKVNAKIHQKYIKILKEDEVDGETLAMMDLTIL